MVKQETEDRLTIQNRKYPPSNNILLMLGNLLQPQTEGFPHINLDMSFTNVGMWDVGRVMDLSFVITYCHLYNLKRSEYQARSELATFLNIKRSEGAKSMELFTTTVTKQSQDFTDKTEKKTGIKLFGRSKKED
jgi:hypothetical protein